MKTFSQSEATLIIYLYGCFNKQNSISGLYKRLAFPLWIKLEKLLGTTFGTALRSSQEKEVIAQNQLEKINQAQTTVLYFKTPKCASYNNHRLARGH